VSTATTGSGSTGGQLKRVCIAVIDVERHGDAARTGTRFDSMLHLHVNGTEETFDRHGFVAVEV
jgi:hypothetical protein